MNERYVLALDPSGNFYEGKGTTGWCLFDQDSGKLAKFGYIYAERFTTQMDYWDAHISLIDSLAGYHPDIVMEDYLLYGNRATNQINSRLETPQLIGMIKYEAYKRGLKVAVQTALQVKTRWSDEILIHKGYIQKKGNRFYIGTTGIPDHIKDSIRHALHFTTYTSEYRR